jgi:cytochrome c biogenesis protein CcmG/thiol:disulfide interchange protein DsbE
MIRTLVLATALGGVLGTLAVSSEPSGAPLGTAAPSFTAKMLDGRSISPASFGGKVLVLNFWATWCPPCRAETPDMIAAYKSLHAGDVAFLGIDTTETAPVVRTFISAKGVPYQTALAGPDAYNRFGISFIPTTIVLDAHGTVRARWIGGITPTQLAQYVADARAGRNSEYLTTGQKRIDAMLDPKQFDFSGDATTAGPAIGAAQKRVADVDNYAATLVSGERTLYDDDRTSREEGTLLAEAAGAAQRISTTPDQKVAADELSATADSDLNHFADAAAAYRDALTLKPNDPALTFALSRAYYRVHDYPAMAATALDYIKLKPQDADGYDELGLAYQRSRRFADAVDPYKTAVDLMIDDAKKEPSAAKRGDAYGLIADELLDFGYVYVALGDRAGAERTFDEAKHYAALVPADSQYAAMRERTPERAAEGMAAVTLAQGHGTTLALSRWTGPDLPGSLKSTYKYRLIVVAPPNSNVTLNTHGVGSGWVASFCADGLCSPTKVSFVAPAVGVKTYEFQLVPPEDGAHPGKVSVSSGASTAAIP